MGIQNRDYMKRRPDDDDDNRSSSSDSKLEALFSGLLERHPRFFIYVGIGLVILVVTAVVVTMLAAKRQ